MVVEYEKGRSPIKLWTEHVTVQPEAFKQLQNIASLPFIHKHIAVMPDVHLGKGATVGSVIPTKGAIIPAAVGVDIGCGMMALQTSLTANDLPDNLNDLFLDLEVAVPAGFDPKNKTGEWQVIPKHVNNIWNSLLADDYDKLQHLHSKIGRGNDVNHLGTLGSGNHFVEICLDESNKVWVMLHSGSRGVGNRIGRYFIELAKKDMERFYINLPDKDLAYFPEHTEHFYDYFKAVKWAQLYAKLNRDIMMQHVCDVLEKHFNRIIYGGDFVINCHHNYVDLENHYGENVYITRKGAVRARQGDMGIIPGSMGTRSYIVRGLGNPESFNSCSHGAGRVMSRTKAKQSISLDEHNYALRNVVCRKNDATLDETPAAYKDIDAVMDSQKDLVEIVHTLKQVICVKGV